MLIGLVGFVDFCGLLAAGSAGVAAKAPVASIKVKVKVKVKDTVGADLATPDFMSHLGEWCLDSMQHRSAPRSIV